MPKLGFELYIQKSISPIDKSVCRRYLDMFAQSTIEDPKGRYFGLSNNCGYDSGIWRGRYGIEINFWPEYCSTSKPIVFRRISKNQRKFACVYADELVVKNDKYLDKSHENYRKIVEDGELPKMCKCPRHKGSIKVAWKNGEPEFELYFSHGEVKG